MDEIAPEFNSSLQYLWRISNMLWSAHTAAMDTTTTRDEFLILKQLDIELYPRMNYRERWEAYVLKERAKKLGARDVEDYFIFLNNLAHEKKLIMKDKDVMPAVVKNTR